MVKPSSYIVKGSISSSRRYLPTYPCEHQRETSGLRPGSGCDAGLPVLPCDVMRESRDNFSHTPTSLFLLPWLEHLRACNRTKYAALCTCNNSKYTANPSRIEGNIDGRERFKVREVGRTFLAPSQGCTAEAPLYAFMHSGGAAICVVFLSFCGFSAFRRAYTCLTCINSKHSYVARISHMQRCVRECRTVATQKVQ